MTRKLSISVNVYDAAEILRSHFARQYPNTQIVEITVESYDKPWLTFELPGGVTDCGYAQMSDRRHQLHVGHGSGDDFGAVE